MTKANGQISSQNDLYIQRLAKTTPIQIIAEEQGTATGGASTFVLGADTITVPLQGIIDVATELARLNTELNQATEYITTIQARLEDSNFISKAPSAVVERERARFEEAKERRSAIQAVLNQLGD